MTPTGEPSWEHRVSMCVLTSLPFLQRRRRARGSGTTCSESVHRVLVALGTLGVSAETCSGISRTHPAHEPLCGALALARVAEALPSRPVLPLTEAPLGPRKCTGLCPVVSVSEMLAVRGTRFASCRQGRPDGGCSVLMCSGSIWAASGPGAVGSTERVRLPGPSPLCALLRGQLQPASDGRRGLRLTGWPGLRAGSVSVPAAASPPALASPASVLAWLRQGLVHTV